MVQATYVAGIAYARPDFRTAWRFADRVSRVIAGLFASLALVAAQDAPAAPAAEPQQPSFLKALEAAGQNPAENLSVRG